MTVFRRMFDRANSALQLLPWALLGYGLYLQFQIIARRWDQPLTGMFHFRETQTAISAYWMTQGGPKIIYETPVVGFPYTIPFEFPFFQWLVAGLSSLTGLGIDPASRVVAFSAFLGILVVAYRLFRHFELERSTYALFAGLLCVSPLYLYWSSSALIESFALLLALLWLLFYLRALRSRRALDYGLAVLFGVLAALEKITTFPPIVMVGFAVTLVHFWPAVKADFKRPLAFLRENALQGTLLLATVLLPILVTQMWLHAADAAKAQSLLGERLTSESLRSFNFGTLQARMDPEQIYKVVRGRMVEHTLGQYVVVFALLAAAFLRGRKAAWFAGIAVLAYLTGPLLFWKLHQIHYYYQYANGFFLVIAAAITLAAAFRSQAWIAAIALVIGVVGMNKTFDDVYKPNVRPGNFSVGVQSRDFGEWIAANTTPDETLLVFDQDWSSHFHYYAKRKGVAVPAWVTLDIFKTLIADPTELTGGPVGAVIVCDAAEKRYADASKPEDQRRITYLNRWIEGREPAVVSRTCRLYDPKAGEVPAAPDIP